MAELSDLLGRLRAGFCGGRCLSVKLLVLNLISLPLFDFLPCRCDALLEYLCEILINRFSLLRSLEPVDLGDSLIPLQLPPEVTDEHCECIDLVVDDLRELIGQPLPLPVIHIDQMLHEVVARRLTGATQWLQPELFEFVSLLYEGVQFVLLGFG
jgi:hypothetical protein